MLRGGRPTILYDEFDTVFGSAETGRRQNEDHSPTDQRRARPPASRVMRKMGKHTRQFQTYAPMALAGKMTIAESVPETIRDRSIVIPMQRPLPDEHVERWYRHRREAEAVEMQWLLRVLGRTRPPARHRLRGSGSPGAAEGHRGP